MKITKRQLRRIIRESIKEQSGSRRGTWRSPGSQMFDIEMEARDTAVNIFKGGGDREEVEATMLELFPDLADYISTIIDDAEELIEYGVR